MARCRPPAAQAPPAARSTSGSTSSRCAMSGASRRPGRSSRSYLARKLRERGWDGERRRADRRGASSSGWPGSAMSTMPPSRWPRPVAGQRGYGARRVRQSAARGRRWRGRTSAGAATAGRGRARSRPRCVSPGAGGSGRLPQASADRKEREKRSAAMIRAGHGFALARAIVDARAGRRVDARAIWPKIAGAARCR